MTTYSLAAALRRKSRLEAQLNDLMIELSEAKTHYEADGAVSIIDIRSKIATVTTELAQLAGVIQAKNIENGLVGMLIRKNVLQRELANLKLSNDKRNRYGFETRNTETLVPVVHETLKDGSYLAKLTEEYHELNDSLQAQNAQLKVSIY